MSESIPPSPAKEPALLSPAAVGYYRLLGKALLAVIALRLAISVFTLALLGHLSPLALVDDQFHDAPFFALNNMFADSIESGLAQTAITAPHLNDPAVQGWNQPFRDYLLKNHYTGDGLMIRQTPPLANLQLITVAWGAVNSSPELVVTIEICLFLLFGWALTRHPAFSVHRGSTPWVFAIVCVSYPALFMINRGNFHSGFASLAVCAYLACVFTGRARAIGMLVMAVAINYRPNLALLSLAEFLATPLLPTAIARIAKLAAVTLALAGAGYVICHAIDTEYTMTAMLEGLNRYKTVMVVGGTGVDWNSSLYGIFQQGIQLLPDSIRPVTPEAILSVNGKLFALAFAACGLLGLAGVWAFVTGRLHRLEAAFLLLAINMLATPFFAEYHMLTFAAVLLLLPMDWDHARLPVATRQLLGYVGVFALFSLLRFMLGQTLWSMLMVLAVPFVVWRMVLRDLAHPATQTEIMFVASFLAMSSLGGIKSHGLMEAVSILIASLMVLAGVLRRTPGTVRPPLPILRKAGFP